MNKQATWARLRINCLSQIHATLVRHIGLIEPVLAAQRFEDQVRRRPC